MYDVAIIGAGPVGVALANLLGICGLKTLVVEREPQIHDLPRAVHFDDEVMRIFQTMGLAEEIAAVSRINPGMKFVDATGNLLLDWPRPPGIGPQGWNSSYRFHQPDLEQILRRGLQRFEHVDMQLACECTGIQDHGDRIELALSDGAREQARYLVGCDGARSFVRKGMGIEVKNLGFRERWLVVDVLLNRPRPDLGDHSIQYCDPARPSTYVRGPGNRRRWELSLHDHETNEDMVSEENVWRMLSRWLEPDEAILERKAVYEFRSIVVKQWRKGRILLAGDAAHQMPPFMGQGLCAGMRDVINLAWKLRECCLAKAEDTLLDSYGSERGPHVTEYIQTAIRLGGLINTSGTRQALESAFARKDGSARMTSIASSLGPGLNNADNPHAGRLFPQVFLSNDKRLDDHCGYGFVLVADDSIFPDADGLPQQVCVLTTQEHPALAGELDRLGALAVLVRPDRYVMGTAQNSSDLDGLLARIP